MNEDTSNKPNVNENSDGSADTTVAAAAQGVQAGAHPGAPAPATPSELLARAKRKNGTVKKKRTSDEEEAARSSDDAQPGQGANGDLGQSGRPGPVRRLALSE